MRSAYFFLIAFLAVPVIAQSTAFKYQGSLTDSGSPANGSFQMQFKLFDTAAFGNQIGSTLTDIPVTAANGIFSVSLNFGTSALNGANRWIEIAVRRNAGESYVILSPREQIASSPYAVRTLSAQTADTALDSQKLGGVNANQFVQTNDSRLTDARNPLPNSTNYIQNQNAGPQAASNFNISGAGTAASLNVNGPLSFGNISAPAVSPAGQSRFYFDTATNKLRVSENGSAYVNLVGASGVSGSGTVNRLPFWTAATTLGDSNIFQSGSNIAIGIAPQSRFHVNGTSWFQGDTTPLPAAAGKGVALGFVGEQGYVFGFDYASHTPRNLILNGPGGSVGIGTTTPFGRLSVNSPTFGISHSDGTVNLSTYINALGGWFGTVSNHPLHFYTGNSQPQMTLTTGGALGIGITAPTHTLDVNGFFRASHSAGGNVVSETSGGTNSWAKLWVKTPVQQWSIGSSNNFNGNQLYIQDETSSQIRFSVQPNGGPVHLQGNVTGNLGGYGLPKAMLFVLANGIISNCYNGITGATSDGCGFTVVRNVISGVGPTYTVNIGTPTSFRFVSVIGEGAANFSSRVSGRSGNTIRLTFFDSNPLFLQDSDFHLIVY